MLESVLAKKEVATKKKITYKTIASVTLIAMAVILPQIVHLIAGQPGGVQWLPMYLPVLIGGCLLGSKWGVIVGILSPLTSFAITSAFGNAMPALPRLPFMMLELGVMAIVSGLFAKKIYENSLWAFVAVISAQIIGRLVFLGAVFALQKFVPFTVQMIWGQIITGLWGLGLQAVLAPVIMIVMAKAMKKD